MGLIARVKCHTFVFKADPFVVWIKSLDLLVDNEVLYFRLIKYELRLLGRFLLNITHFCILITFCLFHRSLFLLYLLWWRHRARFLTLLFTLRSTASLLSFVWGDIEELWGGLGFAILWFCLSMFSLCRDLNICQDGPFGSRWLCNEGRLSLSCRLCLGLLSFHWR